MITVIGASGQLGTAFRRLVTDGVFVSRPTVDLGDPDRAVAALRPIVRGPVINCAAWTGVDDAEDHEAEATVVNGTAVGAVGDLCAELGVPFVTFSTDYVFAGDATTPYAEDDPVDPINAYGRSKVVGEQAALAHDGSLVVRTSWVQSWTHPCFIRTMVTLAAERTPLRVVDDQVGRPSFADDLAAATLEALDAEVTGLLHLANDGVVSWFELARAAIQLAGLDVLPEPCPSSERPSPARRPAFSVLDTGRAASLGIAMPEWRGSTERALGHMRADGVFGISGRTIPGT